MSVASFVVGYLFLVFGLVAPFVLPFGTNMVAGLGFCAAGTLLIAAGASWRKFGARR